MYSPIWTCLMLMTCWQKPTWPCTSAARLRRKLTQAEAAKILGIDQPKVSLIINGRLDGFSTDRLMRFLNDLGCDVQISISAPHPKARGHLVFA